MHADTAGEGEGGWAEAEGDMEAVRPRNKEGGEAAIKSVRTRTCTPRSAVAVPTLRTVRTALAVLTVLRVRAGVGGAARRR